VCARVRCDVTHLYLNSHELAVAAVSGLAFQDISPKKRTLFYPYLAFLAGCWDERHGYVRC
jgi:hypothetical protein